MGSVIREERACGLVHGTRQSEGPRVCRLVAVRGFRRPFRNLTALWGLAYLIEAAVRIVIAAHTPVGLAFAISKVMPLAVTAVLALWTVAYSLHRRPKGRRIAAAFERDEVHGAGPISNTPTADLGGLGRVAGSQREHGSQPLG